MKQTLLVTKDQLLKAFAGWKCEEPAPGKKRKVIIAFPKPTNPHTATIRWSEHKSTYGKRLYEIELEYYAPDTRSPTA